MNGVRSFSERELFVLRYALDYWDNEHWFEAYALASLEWREALDTHDEEKIRTLQGKHNTAIGWGLTASRLARDGLLSRQLHQAVWCYQITPLGREALTLHDVVEEGKRVTAANPPSSTEGGSHGSNQVAHRGGWGEEQPDRDSRGRFLCRAIDRGLGTDAQELPHSEVAARVASSGDLA